MRIFNIWVGYILLCSDVSHFFQRSLTESKAFASKPLPQYYMVSLRKEWFSDDPWGLMIAYVDIEEKLKVTAYRLAKLEFDSSETAWYMKYLSTKYIMIHFSFPTKI